MVWHTDKRLVEQIVSQMEGQEDERTLHNGWIPTKRTQGRRVMKPRGLSGLQETLNGNVLSPMINPNSTKSLHGKDSIKYVC